MSTTTRFREEIRKISIFFFKLKKFICILRINFTMMEPLMQCFLIKRMPEKHKKKKTYPKKFQYLHFLVLHHHFGSR